MLTNININMNIEHISIKQYASSFHRVTDGVCIQNFGVGEKKKTLLV